MLRNRHRTSVALAALVALAGLAGTAALAGCAAKASGGTPAEPPIGRVPRVLDSTTLRLPVEEYLPTNQQNQRLGAARLALIKRCMSTFGFSYPVPMPTGDQYGPMSLTDRRYGITDAGLARTAGYGLGARDPARQPKPDLPALGADGTNVLSGSGRSVVNGKPVPEGGCIGDAERTLNRAVPSSVDLRKATALQLTSFQQSKADSRVRAVLAQWSACMAGAGYHYADPLAAAADPSFTSPPSAEQIAVALADIDCKAKTNVVGVWFTVDAAYERRAIDADHDAFTQLQKAIATRDRTAAAIIG